MRTVLCIAVLLASACRSKPKPCPECGMFTEWRKATEHYEVYAQTQAAFARFGSEAAGKRINEQLNERTMRHLQQVDEAPVPFDAFVEQIAAENEAYRKQPGGDAKWRIECRCTPVHATERFLVTKCSYYSSTGAAYPHTATYYDTFELRTGRLMALADFVDLSRHDALRKLVEAEFRKQRGDDVEFEKLPLDEHFAPLQEGLVFHYSPGDVGPHARGETTVVIPYAALKDL
jgi:hypothetical protein